jgi:hypothetical protein
MKALFLVSYNHGIVSGVLLIYSVEQVNTGNVVDLPPSTVSLRCPSEGWLNNLAWIGKFLLPLVHICMLMKC